MRESLNEMLDKYAAGERLAEGDGVPRLADRILMTALPRPVRPADVVDHAAFEGLTAENLVRLSGLVAHALTQRRAGYILTAERLIAEHGEEQFREALEAMMENRFKVEDV